MSTNQTAVSLVAVRLTTPPTRQALGGQYTTGNDNGHAREKMVDGIGNLNTAVLQLQEVIGIQSDGQSSISGLLQLVQGNLSFGTFSSGQDSGNLKTIMVSGTSPATPNTAFTLTHNLGKIPNGFVVIQKNAASDFYGTAAGSGWGTTTMSIFCNTASVNFVILVLG